MTTITSKLELLNPEAQLQRGYALALDKNQKVIYSIKQVGVDDIFQLRLAKGKLSAKVLDKGNNNG
jgi:exonuclease VII large subunit